MARTILLRNGLGEAQFEFSKLERAKLYGTRKKIVVDRQNRECVRAELMEDGSMIIRAGMTAQGYALADGTNISLSALFDLDETGEVVEKVPSTLDAEQPLEGPISLDQAMDHQVTGVYMLSNERLSRSLQESLKRGDIYRFSFAYYATAQPQTALLLHNEEGYFALIGRSVNTPWLELAAKPVLEGIDDGSALDDELDFEMF